MERAYGKPYGGRISRDSRMGDESHVTALLNEDTTTAMEAIAKAAMNE
ncbi:hypothetical protein SBA3_2870002 [Candidatus Sulfopaludibacter sp. SbA3]|nr:hypothetical protein SBA3_2870002 [Candidatus Sulfopaludibacter sp. SbA3]